MEDHFHHQRQTEKGNIIIDSRTTLTFLESEVYNSLESALEEAIEAKRVNDPKGLLSPCFEADKDIDLPSQIILVVRT
ncbi:hypothetical protein CRYUN_Cryun14cG0167800 [Craigia yunnanensis]